MLDVMKSKELQATILALRDMDKTIAKRIFKSTREKLVPEWRAELLADATSHLQERVLVAGARVDVHRAGVRLKAAQSVKKMSGGASPRDIGHAVEFGAEYHRAEIGAKSSKGKNYNYTRTVNRQFKPRKKSGHLVWPAAVRMAPRFASLWVQTTVRTLYDAFEGKL